MDTVPTQSEVKPKMPRSHITRPIKLKDHPFNRTYVFLPLKQIFGFCPENIAIEKVPSSHDKFVVRVFLTEEQSKIEDEKIAAEEKAAKEKTDKLEAKAEAKEEENKNENN